jgi:hypothetical protein
MDLACRCIPFSNVEERRGCVSPTIPGMTAATPRAGSFSGTDAASPRGQSRQVGRTSGRQIMSEKIRTTSGTESDAIRSADVNLSSHAHPGKAKAQYAMQEGLAAIRVT